MTSVYQLFHSEHRALSILNPLLWLIHFVRVQQTSLNLWSALSNPNPILVCPAVPLTDNSLSGAPLRHSLVVPDPTGCRSVSVASRVLPDWCVLYCNGMNGNSLPIPPDLSGSTESEPLIASSSIKMNLPSLLPPSSHHHPMLTIK